eukprot:GHRQ01005389.1.p2 GENE.GHRQ01005389.1~~GHRQ01005389.1.p2  ORF type:complete len:107 (+),score=27.11 GHRQ01005389.1:203-523(+)
MAKVYIGNLPPTISESAVEREFDRFGRCRVWVARKPPGFGEAFSCNQHANVIQLGVPQQPCSAVCAGCQLVSEGMGSIDKVCVCITMYMHAAQELAAPTCPAPGVS